MMKKVILTAAILSLLCCVVAFGQTSRFLQLYNDLHGDNGYFSPEGAPYHSIETAIVEAPDYGHVSTSEAYSYYIWLELAYGVVTGDYSGFSTAWNAMEQQIIPSVQDGNSNYNPNSPATYAAEWDLPDNYPSELRFGLPVGIDPISASLHSVYGPDIYGMHWLVDCDDWYEYGGQKPVFINTFQRGPQESTWETIPHPSIDDFSKGGVNGNGFMPLFTQDASYSPQWRYTNAPDADARVLQAMLWGYFNNAQISGYASRAAEMGDWLRLSFFDKYFKTIGANTNENTGGNGYDSCHYLLSWYYAWGGGIGASWAWRIGSSHCHFGYQNVMAAWAASGQSPAGNMFVGQAQNAASDWSTSLSTQLDFLEWCQSAQGLFSGGATNSWLGRYAPYPAGQATFNGMAYDPNPVYHDPGSGTWMGWQGWGIERLAEYYYRSNDPQAGNMLSRWASFVNQNITTGINWRVPGTLAFSGQPGQGLIVSIEGYNQDLGVAASLARGLLYYGAATNNNTYINKAVALMDSIWDTAKDAKGLSVPEPRSDYERFLTQEVYVPPGMTGQMGNGDVIQNGVTFLDIRSKYWQDDYFNNIIYPAISTGQVPVTRYHRTWAQIECALTYLTIDLLGVGTVEGKPGDVNDDDVINIIDALMIAQYSVDLPVTINTGAADVNCDGNINIIDALMVAQYVVGLISNLGC